MIDIVNWVVKHWPELAAAFGIGGGSGFAAKKFADRKQIENIDVLEKNVKAMNEEISQLKHDVVVNTMFDKQFRDQVEKDYHAIKDDMKEVKRSLEQILNHLLNKK